jgi:hypothetical protein
MDEHNAMDDQYDQIPEGYEPGSDADIHVSSILFTGVIGAVLLVVIVMLLKALYYHTLDVERAQKQGKGIDVTLADLRSKQLVQIGQYRWVNAHAGQVGIPIDQAMQLVWQEQAAHPSEGIEISDWDHNPSDQHAVPGDLVMYGNLNLNGDFGNGMAGVIRAMAQGKSMNTAPKNDAVAAQAAANTANEENVNPQGSGQAGGGNK